MNDTHPLEARYAVILGRLQRPGYPVVAGAQIDADKQLSRQLLKINTSSTMVVDDCWHGRLTAEVPVSGLHLSLDYFLRTIRFGQRPECAACWGQAVIDANVMLWADFVALFAPQTWQRAVTQASEPTGVRLTLPDGLGPTLLFEFAAATVAKALDAYGWR